VPHTDPFSGAGRPWAAYSWLFELLIFGIFQRLGLVGLVAYSAGMVVAIAAALHRLIRRLQADFTIAALLTAVAVSCIAGLFTPRPWLFSILFFTLELDLLMQARKTGRMRGLLWLPVVFALWTNLHIQFFAGLAVLAIALTEAALARRWTGIHTRIRPGWMSGIFVACVLAALCSPYGWGSYSSLFGMAAQSGILSRVTEMQAMSFRHFNDWSALLFAFVATGLLARTRRFAFFESVLLAFAVYISFHSQRDVWVLAVVASGILASEIKGDKDNRFLLTASAAPAIAVASVLALLLGFRALGVNNVRLRANLAKQMPVRAVEFVKEKGLNGPLFNNFDWGGYLIWDLRMPVSAYGGISLVGEARPDRLYTTWEAAPDWAVDPDLLKANLVIAPVALPLTQLLRLDPRFQLADEDKLAAVFVSRSSLSSGKAELAAAADKSASSR
jgi:hypothetical protein